MSDSQNYLDLLASPATTDATRAVISARLEPKIDAAPQFFSPDDFELLKKVCGALSEDAAGDGIAWDIDSRLSKGGGNGWRFDALPEDGTAIRLFLNALRARDFANLSPDDQNGLLVDARDGSLTTLPSNWPAARFFGDFLGEVAEIYAGLPTTQAAMRFAGFADKPGWNRIELNQRHARETSSAGEFSLDLEPVENGETDWKEIAPQNVAGMKFYAPDEEVDALIIGLGAGGGPLAARLAGAGLSVVALEAGKWHDPRNFATDERAQNFLFWLDERLSAGENAVAFGANNSGIGVGGSTVHYTAYTPRAQDDDLKHFSEFGVGVNWPFGLDVLEPYYEEVEWFIGVSGPNPYPWGKPRRKGYPLAPLPVNGAGQLMQRGCDALGLKTSPAANAALSAPYFSPGVGWRAACSNRGFCQAGCSTGAKSSVDVTYVPLAVKNGAEIRPESFVTTIETANGLVTGVVYSDASGREIRQKCKALFLCAGSIETPRLLLLNGLANDSGQVGQNFMAHPGMQVWGTFEEEIRPFKGIPGALISEDTHRPKNADFAGGYLLQSLGVMPVTYASQYARSQQRFGAELRSHLESYNHVAGINILGDCLPYSHNFLELSNETDARGLPKPRLHFSVGENEAKMERHAETLMRDIFSAAGAKTMWSFSRHAHVIGTARMGKDASQSVVNANGQSHQIPNLYISDNSTFPSALSVNPALTIMALSLRTADLFLANR